MYGAVPQLVQDPVGSRACRVNHAMRVQVPPVPFICRCRSAGGAAALKAVNLKGYAGSNPVNGVYASVV